MAQPQRKEDESATDWTRRAAVDREAAPETTKADMPKPVRSENVRDAAGAEPEMNPGASDGETAAGEIEAGRSSPLFSSADLSELRARWNKVQASFVDEPRHAVEEADSLVAAVTDRLTACFANERAGLEKQWDRGEEVSTEDLRVALQRYRAYFSRLLNA